MTDVGERARIMTWLRRQAQESHQNAYNSIYEDHREMWLARSAAFASAADAIKRGDHLLEQRNED